MNSGCSNRQILSTREGVALASMALVQTKLNTLKSPIVLTKQSSQSIVNKIISNSCQAKCQLK